MLFSCQEWRVGLPRDGDALAPLKTLAKKHAHGQFLLVVVIMGTAVMGCGRLYSCYDAILIGVGGYQITVERRRDKVRRGIHTTADAYTVGLIRKWDKGDELVVCNALVTNVTKNTSAQCGDFGCLIPWP